MFETRLANFGSAGQKAEKVSPKVTPFNQIRRTVVPVLFV